MFKIGQQYKGFEDLFNANKSLLIFATNDEKRKFLHKIYYYPLPKYMCNQF